MYNKLRSIRKSKGLTLEEVAAACGVSSQSVSRWETGQTYVSDERFEQLASLYGYTAEELKDYVSEDSIRTYLKSKHQLSDDFDKIISRPISEIRTYSNPAIDGYTLNRAKLILSIYDKVARLSDEGLLRIDERVDTLLSMQEDK